MKSCEIRQLKNRLPVKFRYAERVVERAKDNGITITTRDVYATLAGRSRVHYAIIYRILEILVEESESQIASFA